MECSESAAWPEMRLRGGGTALDIGLTLALAMTMRRESEDGRGTVRQDCSHTISFLRGYFTMLGGQDVDLDENKGFSWNLLPSNL